MPHKVSDHANSSGSRAYPHGSPRVWAVSRRERRARLTGRKGERSDTFVRMLHIVLCHDTFKNLTPVAHKTLNYLASQCNGYNNGDLDICEKNAKKRGLRMSAASLRRGAKELLNTGFIELTRQGGRNRNSLYALSWYDIPFDPNKHDYGFRGPTMRWQRQKSSSSVTQLGASVTQSLPPVHAVNDTTPIVTQSAPLSIGH